MYQHQIDRVQEYRKCIECFLCQDVCHVIREHKLHDQFIGQAAVPISVRIFLKKLKPLPSSTSSCAKAKMAGLKSNAKTCPS